jgi:hypothetical protein
MQAGTRTIRPMPCPARTRRLRFAAALALLAGSIGAPAEAEGACFCLSNDRHGYFEWGCVLAPFDAAGDAPLDGAAAGAAADDAAEAPEGGAVPSTAVCLSEGRDGVVPVTVEITEGFVRVPEGRGACLPCAPPIAVSDLPPRFRGLFSEVLSGGEAAPAGPESE